MTARMRHLFALSKDIYCGYLAQKVGQFDVLLLEHLFPVNMGAHESHTADLGTNSQLLKKC